MTKLVGNFSASCSGFLCVHESQYDPNIHESISVHEGYADCSSECDCLSSSSSSSSWKNCGSPNCTGVVECQPFLCPEGQGLCAAASYLVFDVGPNAGCKGYGCLSCETHFAIFGTTCVGCEPVSSSSSSESSCDLEAPLGLAASCNACPSGLEQSPDNITVQISWYASGLPTCTDAYEVQMLGDMTGLVGEYLEAKTVSYSSVGTMSTFFNVPSEYGDGRGPVTFRIRPKSGAQVGAWINLDETAFSKESCCPLTATFSGPSWYIDYYALLLVNYSGHLIRPDSYTVEVGPDLSGPWTVMRQDPATCTNCLIEAASISNISTCFVEVAALPDPFVIRLRNNSTGEVAVQWGNVP